MAHVKQVFPRSRFFVGVGFPNPAAIGTGRPRPYDFGSYFALSFYMSLGRLMLRNSAKKPSFSEKTRFLCMFSTLFLYESIGIQSNWGYVGSLWLLVIHWRWVSLPLNPTYRGVQVAAYGGYGIRRMPTTIK